MRLWTSLSLGAVCVLTRVAGAQDTTSHRDSVARRDTTARDTTARDTTAHKKPSLIQYLNLDKLRLDGIGVTGGVVSPLQIEPAATYSVEADYGEIIPHWRLFVGAAVWSSRYTDAAVHTLINTIYRNSVINPSPTDSLRYQKISISDVVLSIDLRFSPLRAQSFLRPYLTAGVATHVQDASGAAIRGTIVEHTLDGFSPGVAGAVGLEVRLASWLIADGQARYDLLSGDRFGTLRAGGRYLFGPERQR